MREDFLARIQGFLLALQTINNSVGSRAYREFTFLPVPEAGDLPLGPGQSVALIRPGCRVYPGSDRVGITTPESRMSHPTFDRRRLL
jgi:hypothetical protein